MSEAEIEEADFNTAVLVFAHYLGIDLESEKELLPIAESALRNLPQGWELGIGDGDNAGIPYFFNESTGESLWKHPKESIYLKKVKEEKKRLQSEAEDRKRSRKSDNSSNGRSQNQQRNQSDRKNDDTNKGSKNDSNKGRGGSKQNSVEDFEVTEVSDFFMDDEDDSLGKSTIKRNTAANAVVSNKKGVSDGGNYGMSSADFLSDDEEVEVKNLRSDNFLKKTDSKGKASTWNDASSNHSEREKEKEKEKEVRTIKSRSESLSWDDESVGTSHNQSRKNSLDKKSDLSSSVRGRDEVTRIGGKSDDRRPGDFDKVVDKTGSRAGSGRSSPGKADVSDRSRERLSKERDVRERESKDRENKERDARERENRDRENKERDAREARERDIRDAETREREKNRLRLKEKEAANNAAVASSAISSEVAALKADNSDLEDRLADLRNRHKQVSSSFFLFRVDIYILILSIHLYTLR